MTRHILLKIAAVVSYLSLYLLVSITRMNAEQARFFWLWYGIPSALILLMPKRWSALAQGMAVAQGVYFCQQTVLLLTLSLPSNGLSNGMVSLIGFDLAQAFLVVAALILGLPSKIADFVRLGVGVTASLLFILLSSQRQAGTQGSPSPLQVYSAVGCLDRYALAHGGTYPPSFEELTRTTGEFCVTGPESNGSWRAQKLVYQPAQESDGRITGYSILFGPDDFWGRVQTAWYVDQTGLIHTSPKGRVANKQGPIWSNETIELKQWSECYAKYAARHPASKESFDWKPVLWPQGRCEPDIGDIHDGRVELGQFYTAYFHVKAPDGSGKQSGFYVIARPNQYGASGLRSYYLDETGIIRGTPQNREPNSTDEPTPECEWKEHLNCLSN